MSKSPATVLSELAQLEHELETLRGLDRMRDLAFGLPGSRAKSFRARRDAAIMRRVDALVDSLAAVSA